MALLQSRPQPQFSTGFTLDEPGQVKGVAFVLTKAVDEAQFRKLLRNLASKRIWAAIIGLEFAVPESLQKQVMVYQRVTDRDEWAATLQQLQSASQLPAKHILVVGDHQHFLRHAQQAGFLTAQAQTVQEIKGVISNRLEVNG